MKMFIRLLSVVFLMAMSLEATPTSLFWTNCTTEILPTGTGNIDVDNYFTVFNRRHHGQFFNPDVGLVVGIFSWGDLKAEAGIDYLGGADDPLIFNAKVGMAEDKLFCNAPAFNVGIFNVGTRDHGHERTNQNIVDFIFGHSLPKAIGGNLYLGVFSGSRAMGKNRQGVMVGYTQSFCSAKYCGDKDYFKWALSADYASGKNTIGGGGVAVTHYFTPDISIETGPVWFNTAKYNGTWKWSVQLDIKIPVFNCKK